MTPLQTRLLALARAAGAGLKNLSNNLAALRERGHLVMGGTRGSARWYAVEHAPQPAPSVAAQLAAEAVAQPAPPAYQPPPVTTAARSVFEWRGSR